MTLIAINTRVLATPVSGVQRYTLELLSRWNGSALRLAPAGSVHGLVGHAWEQFVLPTQLHGRLLFSPSNSGPLKTTEQVVTIHDTAVFDCPENFHPRFAAWYRFLLPKLARRAKKVITVSEFSKERIVFHAGVKPESVTVIPNGVDSRFCPEAHSSILDAIAALNLPSASYVLTVGSIEPRKNLQRLLKAWNSVQERLPGDLWLIIAGNASPHVFGSVQFDTSNRKVRFVGHVGDRLLPTLYAAAMGMAYVSTYEGFGLPPLEAMASGTPVLAGNRTALPEILGDAALLVDPCDTGAIGQGLLRLVADEGLRAELRQKGLQRAREYSWDRTAATTWDLLQDLARK